jgi:hypothetical protein
MADFQSRHMAATGSACLEKARAMLLALQPAGAELLFLCSLEVLRWTV